MYTVLYCIAIISLSLTQVDTLILANGTPNEIDNNLSLLSWTTNTQSILENQILNNQENTEPFDIPITNLQQVTSKKFHLVFEQRDAIYSYTQTEGSAQLIPTPGYIYNQNSRPILLPNDELLYSGNGIWTTNIITGISIEIAAIPVESKVTSLVSSKNGNVIAWTTEAIGNHDTSTSIYVSYGLLSSPQLVYENTTSNCPCFQAFSVSLQATKNPIIYLVDDRGDDESSGFGLWSLSPANTNIPQEILQEFPFQKALSFLDNQKYLLFSANAGIVPYPTDNSVPSSSETQMYTTGINILSLDNMSRVQTILPAQNNVQKAGYWEMSPQINPNESTILYIGFSASEQEPYDRDNTLYEIVITPNSSATIAEHSRLIVIGESAYIELGTWLDNNTISLYSNNTLYLLNLSSNTLASIGTTAGYAHIIGMCSC